MPAKLLHLQAAALCQQLFRWFYAHSMEPGMYQDDPAPLGRRAWVLSDARVKLFVVESEESFTARRPSLPSLPEIFWKGSQGRFFATTWTISHPLELCFS